MCHPLSFVHMHFIQVQDVCLFTLTILSTILIGISGMNSYVIRPIYDAIHKYTYNVEIPKGGGQE